MRGAPAPNESFTSQRAGGPAGGLGRDIRRGGAGLGGLASGVRGTVTREIEPSGLRSNISE